ncbi:ATP-binding cassette domain-containing protein [Butyrivibrio sp.]|uniref:ABC transporter ATP-binding protein n=1 Tax=Butyrivibrio sp. TaxID=28121 RepID=UPI0025C1621A|nr:ATP-binding cassette domain-containing protein [Butyrivibrio sp.]MBQ9303791.1 ATP-binding cassette domain-containing protein [Butyrivibrio sp.]
MIIEVKDVSKAYGEKKVLDGFNLNIEDEHSYIITGGRGAGKTTLLRLVLGLEKPDSGKVGLLGDYKYPYINAGVVFQEDRLCEGFSAVTNCAMVSKKVFKQTVREELLKLLPEDKVYIPVRNLSSAERRMVCIARACCIPSDVLVMDEPFKGLNPSEKEKAISFIRDKQGSGSLVIASEDTTGLDFGRIITL